VDAKARPRPMRAAALAAGRRIYVGTAGWTNPPAERVARAASESHLQHYATRFDAVEVNSSFHRPHRRETYERWRESTPPAFRFSVKVPRSVTHECALRHCRAELRQFLSEVAGLGAKLRVILVQTPPGLVFEPRAVGRFFGSLKEAGPWRIASEARHPSWFTARAGAVLSRYGVSQVAADPATVAGGGEPAGGPGLVYYRLHGSPRMYYSSYSTDYLRELSMKLHNLRGRSKDIWCVFDNTARHAAWVNALALRASLQ
jgi:uncharacterized protein YecE (DUF72 family)